MNPDQKNESRRAAGYSLIEVLIAAAVLAVGIAAAAMLANSLIVQQESSTRTTAAINLHEQVARLYRLGLNHAQITNILPETFVTDTASLAPERYYLNPVNSTTPASFGGIQMEVWTNELRFAEGWDAQGSLVIRGNTNVVVRESIR